MRIIAGEFRGRTLRTPKGEGTRPTSERVREAMMSTVHSARGGFDGAVVFDAFAGSGALGLEALSRGARSVQFCERAGEALKALDANVGLLGLDARRARVRKGDVLKGAPRARPPFDLVFLDPPYACDAEEALGVVEALRSHASLADGAIVVYEHEAAAGAAVQRAARSRDLRIAQSKKYGDTVVDVLRPAAPSDAAHRSRQGGKERKTS